MLIQKIYYMTFKQKNFILRHTHTHCCHGHYKVRKKQNISLSGYNTYKENNESMHQAVGCDIREDHHVLW